MQKTASRNSRAPAGAHGPPTEARGQTASGSCTLSEEAYHRIRDRILRGEYPLGTPLNRRDLAAEFRISLLPVAEALRRLEMDGMVQTEPRKGTRVRIPTPQELEGHIVVRAALECESARRCAQFATPAERADILARASRLDRLRADAAAAPEDAHLSYAIHSYHVEFHLKVAAAGRCPALQRLIEQNHILVLNWVYDLVAGLPKTPQRFHSQLADSLISDDPAAASEAMRAHVWWGWENRQREFHARYWRAAESQDGNALRWRARYRHPAGE